MRPRTKKHLEERYAVCEYLAVEDPSKKIGKWLDGSKYRAVRLEIGCGKGDFVTGIAQLNPDVLFVAMECVKNVIITAMEKTHALKLDNVLFICGFADSIPEIFDKGEVERIYLNFSDPWPKKRNIKNRLTFPKYLDIYKRILSQDGYICQKTDNEILFDYSLESFNENGFTLKNTTRDLHAQSNISAEAGVLTEYEKRFMSLGQPIYRTEAYPTCPLV